MKNEIIETIKEVIKSEDLLSSTEDIFFDLIERIASNSYVGIKEGISIKNWLFNLPNYIFWSKMNRYLHGTFKNYEEQIKMASRFKDNENEFDSFVMFVIDKISKVDNNEKIDYLANLTRCLLIYNLDVALFKRLWKTIDDCTIDELMLIKDTNESIEYENSFIVSILTSIGIFIQTENGRKYKLSSLGKELKNCSLNFNDNSHKSICTKSEELDPVRIGTASIYYDDIEEMFDVK